MNFITDRISKKVSCCRSPQASSPMPVARCPAKRVAISISRRVGLQSRRCISKSTLSPRFPTSKQNRRELPPRSSSQRRNRPIRATNSSGPQHARPISARTHRAATTRSPLNFFNSSLHVEALHSRPVRDYGRTPATAVILSFLHATIGHATLHAPNPGPHAPC